MKTSQHLFQLFILLMGIGLCSCGGGRNSSSTDGYDDNSTPMPTYMTSSDIGLNDSITRCKPDEKNCQVITKVNIVIVRKCPNPAACKNLFSDKRITYILVEKPNEALNYEFFNDEGIAVATTTKQFLDVEGSRDLKLLPIEYKEDFKGDISSVRVIAFGPNKVNMTVKIGN